ncbi:MAG TPA: flagellin [Acidothermaceae bacterium]|nr:flagellin [Acidothermaceae bacterium]
MGLRINTNTDALDAYRNLSMTQSKLSDSLQKLSSGYRINKAADDAAGLSISQGLQAQIGGLQQASKNAQDGINVVQTADGALTEVDSILQRMNVLAVQANNSGSQDAGAVAAAQAEFDQLAGEIDNISKTTKFGQSHLLDGTFGIQGANTNGTGAATQVDLSTLGSGADSVKIQLTGGNAVAATTVTDGSGNNTAGTAYTNDAAGAAALQKDLQSSVDGGALKGLVTAHVTFDGNTQKATVSFTAVVNSKSTASDTMVTSAPVANIGVAAGTFNATGTGGAFQIGADNGDIQLVSIGKSDSATLGVAAGLNVSSKTTIDAVQGAIKQVSALRSTLGAYQNGFQHTINNLNVTVENLQSSNSAIQDTDMASEMVNFTKAQVLQQAGVSMLAQANSASQAVLKLLG